ncbi:integrator complex subunit 2-like isoform X4 [Anthonomus grandis grandis]|uniref:integrator complex subunit 2-like isoform X4 n=1 Tax=Anthonomus grandis grandis TaxID=2921223 RepID=UPI0021658109|nr:integrator complex subunit 2-like isoform X4 [Anthonomus grandis grandis]
MNFKKGVNPCVFSAVQNVDMDKLAKCSDTDIRPVLPCLVRMGLISPLDISRKCTDMKVSILTIVSGMELVNSIVALLSIDFHKLEIDVKKEQQLRLKGNTNRNDSILIGNLSNTSMALEYERSDMTRRLTILLGEVLYIQSQIQENTESGTDHESYIKSSELFDNDIFAEELSDIICIALAELPSTLTITCMVENLLHVHNGPEIICRVVANFPDCFREVCTYLIQTGEKQEETVSSTIRTTTLGLLCQMNPSQSLTVRLKCVELCRMPALAILLSLGDVQKDGEADVVAFVSGLLLGNDQTIRNWIALFFRTGQKKKGEASSNALQQLREDLTKRLQKIIDASVEGRLPNTLVVQASALLRLYCALRGIAAIKFQDEEVNLIVQLLTSHPSPTPAGVRFVSIGLCMLIACPSLITQPDHEKRCIEWVQWLVREEAYFESASGVSASFGEMLLLMAIHFHSQQLSAICELTCATLGMKIAIRHNNMNRMKQVFTQEIFTEQVVTAHAVKVPVTQGLNSNMTGFLPIHCIHQLLKSRAFAKHNVNIKNWIYKQICTSVSPLHPVLPMLVEVYVNSIMLPNAKNAEQANKPLTENEIRKVFQSSIFGQYFDKRQSIFTMDFDLSAENQDVVVDSTSLTPQLLLLYYLLLYEDCRLNNAPALTSSGRKIKQYTPEFMSELPIKYLLHQAQKDQSSYSGLFGHLLKLLATHFPHLTLVEDWLDDMSICTEKKPHQISEFIVVSAFNDIEVNPSRCAKLLQMMLKVEAIDIWPFAESFTQFIRKVLEINTPRFLQDLYKDVWLRLNTVLPRRLWVLTVKNLVDDFSFMTKIDVAEDALQVMRCDERVFRCAPIYAIVLRVLRASLASSKSQLTQHLQANPRLDAHGQVVSEPDREEMCRAAIAAQDVGNQHKCPNMY